VAIVYVIEAHPKGDPCPYKGVEDVTRENLRDGILCRQPTTLAARLTLAKQFKQRLNVGVPIYVDAMSNAAWRNLGGGPNMAILIDAGGTVLGRQGWFDAKSADELIAALPPAPRGFNEQSPEDRALGERLQSLGITNSALSEAVRNADVKQLQEWLAKYPSLATIPTSIKCAGASADGR